MLLMCEIGKGVLTENLVFDKVTHLPARTIVATRHVPKCYELTHGEVMLQAEAVPSAYHPYLFTGCFHE